MSSPSRPVAHAYHDFTAKLRQPSVLPQVRAYVQWRQQLAAARAEGQPAPAPPEQAPISINLDLTTACNYRCDHCIDWDILNTPPKHAEGELRSSLELMAARGLRSVILIGGGEPTLYPHFADFVKFLKDLELQVAIVSNGSRGDRLLAAAEHMTQRDWIRLSLDAGSNELFIKMHKPVSKGCDLDEICSWIPKIKERNPAVAMGFSYIIVWRGAQRADVDIHENIHEIVMATERAKAARFDYISLKPYLERRPSGAEVLDPTHADRELTDILRRIRAEVDRAKALADDRFAVVESLNLRVLEDGSWERYTRQPHVCHMQALRQVLTPMGVFNCPAHRGVDKARVTGPAGYRDAAAAQDAGYFLTELMDRFDATAECAEVTCLYNDVNWWLEEMVNDPRSLDALEPSDERNDFFL